MKRATSDTYDLEKQYYTSDDHELAAEQVFQVVGDNCMTSSFRIRCSLPCRGRDVSGLDWRIALVGF